MDLLSASIALGLLGTVLPVAVGVGCFVAWRHTLVRPGVFLVVAVFTMFGLSGFVHWVVSTGQLLVVALHPTFVVATASDHASLLWTEIYKALIVATLTACGGFYLLRASMRVQQQ